MFKRRARILFLDPGPGIRARMAQAWMAATGRQWVRPEAAALEPGPLPPALARIMAEVGIAVDSSPLPGWQRAQQDHHDLVVVLDGATAPDRDALVGPFRYKVWDLAGECPAPAAAPDDAALRGCREALRHRVEGLIGGFRMKAREDDNPG